jgi:hypothetical protein
MKGSFLFLLRPARVQKRKRFFLEKEAKTFIQFGAASKAMPS